MKKPVSNKIFTSRLNHVLIGAFLGFSTIHSAAAGVDLAKTPLFVSPAIDPNVMFVIDDSGSMHWEVTPDALVQPYYMFPRVSGIYGAGDYNNSVPSFNFTSSTANERLTAALYRSTSNNKSYYNPSVTYTPWARGDGTFFPNALPTSAYHHPIRTSLGTRNLTVNNSQSASWYVCSATHSCSSSTSTRTFYPAVYYYHDGGSLTDVTQYDQVEIRSTTASYVGHGRNSRTDCAARLASTCTYAEEIQNFANWYTYYRSRMLTAQAGIGRAFALQSEGMRVGFGAINKGSSSIDGVSTDTIERGVRKFAGTDRQGFFDLLYQRTYPPSGTPLRAALNDAGQYFRRSDNRGPWSNTPGTAGTSPDVECRQSYSILMTDGYWSTGSTSEAATSAARANVDNTAGPTITGPGSQTFTYNAVSPFRDSFSNVLADVAMYYWKNDLRTDMQNKVPVTARNPAFWQHMVTFGVGLGVNGNIDPAAAFAAITTPATITWPDPLSSNPAKLDDLLHAAVNGRGDYFSASNPVAFADGLIEVLKSIVRRVEASATASATSSTVLLDSSKSYEAGFRSGDWTGTFTSHEILARGKTGALIWDAEAELRARTPDSRKIFTHSGSAGIEFTYASLTSAQRTALAYNSDDVLDNLHAQRIDWLRGKEDVTLPSGISFRSRNQSGELRLLGDIVNANPQYAGKTNFGYSKLGAGNGGTSYASHRAADRPDVVYLAANDGMLHAFDPETGKELFAYIPSELLKPDSGRRYAPLSQLTAPNYSHRYFVDGTPTIGDAFIAGSWKSVLVGSMGAGGKTIFALDVTQPATFNRSKVLWEFTDPDLGYGVTQPAIVPMPDGKWAAVFGNGYNSTSHKSVLFFVDISNGSLIKKINTGVGSSGTPNGLAAAYVTDFPENNRLASRVYAGDILGNLWRFDVGASSATKLFTAKDSLGNTQPITTRPIGASWSKRPGSLVVSFGTGSFFRVGDTGDYRTQTIYGIIDEGAEVTGRDKLVQQTIVSQSNVEVTTVDDGIAKRFDVREVSRNALLSTHQGWYLDLAFGSSATGERVISRGSFPSGVVRERVRFTTLIPDADPCGSGRSGYAMDIDLFSGGSSEYSVIDLNNDKLFNELDLVDGKVVSGLKGGTSGEELRVIRDKDNGGGDCEVKANGKCWDSMELDGRQYWEQLR